MLLSIEVFFYENKIFEGYFSSLKSLLLLDIVSSMLKFSCLFTKYARISELIFYLSCLNRSPPVLIYIRQSLNVQSFYPSGLT